MVDMQLRRGVVASPAFPSLVDFWYFRSGSTGSQQDNERVVSTAQTKQEHLYTIFGSSSAPSFSSLATLPAISDTPAFPSLVVQVVVQRFNTIRHGGLSYDNENEYQSNKRE